MAPVCLPPVGGFATARADRFNLDEIVSFAAAYTRVSGSLDREDGSIGILATAVVEGLNILDVVTAERVVAQVSIALPTRGGYIDVSLAGSCFEGLRLAGCEANPTLNQALMFPAGPQPGHRLPLAWQDVLTAGRTQAQALVDSFKACSDGGADRWAQERHGRLNTNPPAPGGKLLCSLLDGFGPRGSFESYGHIVVIPGFGRFHFGELFLSGDAARLVMIRAELGCPVTGGIGVCTGGGGGVDNKT